MSHWHCSGDELAVCHRQQKECERAQEALSRLTSCFQQLLTSLGSSADSSFLREEVDQTRRVAHQLCTGLSQRLLHLLSECDSASSSLEDRQMLERLWVLSLSAFEGFLSDLRTARLLIGHFPLTQPKDRSSLVNTEHSSYHPGSTPVCPWELEVVFKPAESPAGPAQRFLTVAAMSSWCPRLLSAGCTDGMVGVAARVASAQVPWHTVEESPGWDFTNHIAALEAMLAEMQLRVSVPFWSVQATQPAWAEAGSEHEDPEDTLEDLMEVEVVNKTPPCFQPPCCGLGCVG